VLELLRRLAGAPWTMSDEQLKASGAEIDDELFNAGMDGLYFLMCDSVHPRRRLYQARWQAQQSEARAVIDELHKHGAEAIVLKGAEAGARYAPAQGLYVSGDVDLLVTGSDLWHAERALYTRGYMRARYVDEALSWKEFEPLEAKRFEAVAYELTPFTKKVRVAEADRDCQATVRTIPHGASLFEVKDDGLYTAISFDIHHNLLFKFNVAPFLKRTVPSALGCGRTLNPADHLWFLIHRYYYEVAMGGFSELRALVPIAAMVNDRSIDWPLLVRNAVECNTTAPFLYWLTFFHQLGASGIPPEVLATLRSHHARSERDFGWQLARLLGVVESFPRDLLA
jgi:hypothetical protein